MTQNRSERLAPEKPQHIETNAPMSDRLWDTRELAELTMTVDEIASGKQKCSDSGIPVVERALTVHEKAFGPEHPTVALSLNTLARLYREKGEFTKAEPLYQRALAILEKVFGVEHPDVATSLYGLAGLYRAQGDHARAKLLYYRAVNILENALKLEPA